mgnify:CR=1 FL=1
MKSKKIFVFLASAVCSYSIFAQSEAIISKIADEMVELPSGIFYLGSDDYENNEHPKHDVKISKIAVQKTEVTQAEYRDVVGVNYSRYKGDNRPVEEVSWFDAVVFCNKLSIASGYTPVYSLNGETNPENWGDIPRRGNDDEIEAWTNISCDFSANGYRLPTEAEWEYAAHANTYTLYSGSNNVTDVAWNNASVDGETHDVATKAPNDFGLYDMSGNVWEWCWDWYGNYDVTETENPLGAPKEITGKKIRRGGSMNSSKEYCRVTNRASSEPAVRGVDLGFRVVRTLDGSAFSVNSSASEAEK